MQALANQQYLCLQPLPVSAPGLQARLGGMVIKRCGFALNPMGEAQVLTVKLPPYVLPSPIYLLKQELSPEICSAGVSEYEFLHKLTEAMEPEHVLPVVYGFKYLFYLQAIALRCFQLPHFFYVHDVLDLKVVLQAAHYFGSLHTLKESALTNLPTATAALKLKTGSGLAARADALPLILSYLKEHDAPILQFCLKGKAERIRRLQQSMASGEVVIVVDGQSLKAARCLKINDKEATLLTCDRSMQVDKLTLQLCDPLLIAPQGVLTPERQGRLNFALDKIVATLNAVDSAQLTDNTPPTLEAQLWAKLSPEERQEYLKVGTRNPQLLDLPPLFSSDFYKELLFFYQADNFPQCLIDSELELYRHSCRVRFGRRLQRYMQEVKAAATLIDEDDERQQALFMRIAKYPQTL